MNACLQALSRTCCGEFSDEGHRNCSSMKIQWQSDLHSEYRYPLTNLPACGEDLAVVADDIRVGLKEIRFKPVLRRLEVKSHL